MIIITGPGRSGTSLLARAYREIGLDPGGCWNDAVDAGLEDPDVVLCNKRILADLDLSPYGLRGDAPSISEYGALRALDRTVKRYLSDDRRAALRRRFEASRLNYSGRGFTIPWARLDAVAAKYGEIIRLLADSRTVVKDPLFCWSLPVWITAGARIDSVVVSTRAISEMTASRSASRLMSLRSSDRAKDAVMYGIGCVFASCWDAGIETAHVRFPAFVRDPSQTARRLPLPDESYRDRLVLALSKIADPAMVTFSD